MNANATEIPFKDEVYALVGAAIEGSTELGTGFLETMYQEALELELKLRGIPYQAQIPIPITCKGPLLAKTYVPDFICFNQIIVEIKALKQLTTLEEAQLLNYLKATGMPVGLLLNFGTPRLEGKRMILTHTRSTNKRQ